jgi:hypothetical protein
MNFPWLSIGGVFCFRTDFLSVGDLFVGAFDDPFERNFGRGVFEEGGKGANQFTPVLLA